MSSKVGEVRDEKQEVWRESMYRVGMPNEACRGSGLVLSAEAVARLLGIPLVARGRKRLIVWAGREHTKRLIASHGTDGRVSLSYVYMRREQKRGSPVIRRIQCLLKTAKH